MYVFLFLISKEVLVVFHIFFPLAFACSDNSSNSAFGAGNVGQIKTGDCYGDMIGYQIAQCNAMGYWIVTDDKCVTRVIKYLKDRSEVM